MAGDVVRTVYGPMSIEFAKSPLGDLCVPDGGVQTGPFGSQLHSSDYVECGTPIITVEHLGENRIIHKNLPRVTDEDKKRLERYTLITGDIVFSRVGSVDRRAIVHPEEDGWLFSGRCLRVRPDRKKIDPGFLSWFFGLTTFQEHIRQIAVGATMPSLNTKILGDVAIYYPPPLKHQQAIACILGALDDKIELNRRMNRTLEDIAWAIFKSWFVDFDPVRAKAAGQKPPGLKPEIAGLFPDCFEDSELGEIPKGWAVTPLSELTTLITKGTTPTKGDVNNSPGSDVRVNYVRANCIEEDGSILADKLLSIPLSVHTGVLKRSILESGDILYTIAGTIGRIALAEDWILPANTNQAVAIIRPASSVPPGFLILTMRQEEFRQNLHSNIIHAVQANLSLGMLAKAKGVVPSISALPKLFAPVEAILFRTINNRSQSRTLAALRDSLLSKLISGEIRVKDAERIAARCV
jgi:type I restriction enzyme, S subunit